MPPPKPLSKTFRGMSDRRPNGRAAADPDAGVIPPGFSDKATVRLPQASSRSHCVTSRDHPLVQAQRRGYQSRMGRVLRSYIEAKRKRTRVGAQ